MFDYLRELFKVQSQDSEAKQIAKHLSKVLLWEWKGTDQLYPDVREKCQALVKRMANIGKPIVVYETFRTAKKQDQYAENPEITKAKGLESYHNYGLAFDVFFLNWEWKPPSEKWWEELGKEGKKLGLEWGGDWKDFPDKGHFQWRGGNGKITFELLKPYFEKRS